MKYIKTYQSYKESSINEEFIGGLVKGALSKLFQAFSAPFKDLVNDIKTMFKEEDPNSVKNIVMTNLNQAIDGAQKSIREIKTEGDVLNIMSQFITSLTELANGIGKDFENAIKDKTKSTGATDVAKAIIMGDEQADWDGIVGLLSDPKYLYSKAKYEEGLSKINAQGKGADQVLKMKQNYASKFFDEFQKNITNELNKQLSKDEIEKIYNDSLKKGGVSNKYTLEDLQKFKNDEVIVRYKLKGYDNNKKPELQENEIGTKKIEEVDANRQKVIFIGKNGIRIEKNFSDILGPENNPQKTNVAEDLKKELGEIKNDGEKMGMVKDLTDMIKDPNKVNLVKKFIDDQGEEKTEA